MDFMPYKNNESFEGPYYKIPKELFINPIYKSLDLTSIMLYSLLLDRLSISMKNNWVDKNGNVYIIFSRKEAEGILDLSDKPITNAFKKLKETKLISEIRSGFKKNNIIYVGKTNNLSVENSMNRKKYDSRSAYSTEHETENVRCNYNNYNKNNYSNYFTVREKHSNFNQREYPPEYFNKFYVNLNN